MMWFEHQYGAKTDSLLQNLSKIQRGQKFGRLRHNLQIEAILVNLTYLQETKINFAKFNTEKINLVIFELKEKFAKILLLLIFSTPSRIFLQI